MDAWFGFGDGWPAVRLQGGQGRSGLRELRQQQRQEKRLFIWGQDGRDRGEGWRLCC